jgi:hypothetical protein
MVHAGTILRNGFGAGHFKIRMNRDDLRRLSKQRMKISEPVRAPCVLAKL